MEIRKSCIDDLPQILDIYQCAREYMKKSGNPTQWGDNYPCLECITKDINDGISYVICENNVPHGVFVFFRGDDPTYFEIEGAWLNENPYGVIHRIGSDGKISGVFKALSDFAKEQIADVRIDTHNDNQTMQHLLEKHGFKNCGIIHLANGQPRLAYHYTRAGL